MSLEVYSWLNTREVALPAFKRPKENIVDKGKVKWFNERKGFGFIVPENGGEDLFIHHSNIAAEGFRSLYDGQDVEFEVAQGKKGPEAVNVHPCSA